MNDKQAHEKLKKINSDRNKIGVGGYRDSRRERCNRHEKFNETMNELNKASDESKLKESDND